jgi:16S rRNA (uracil1498-N3)-methyltransferase
MALKIDNLFYTADILETLCLEETETKHCVNVLRKRVGDTIYVTDGKGNIFVSKILETKAKTCKVKILETIVSEPKKNKVFIGICPTKNADRIAYFIEKAVEIGVDGFVFIKTKHTVAKNVNMGRIEKIMVSAMKQSLKSFKPVAEDIKAFSEVIKGASRFGSKFMGHLDETSVDILNIKKEGDTLFEIILAQKNGFIAVKMGESRLRTETAGLVAASILTLI